MRFRSYKEDSNMRSVRFVALLSVFIWFVSGLAIKSEARTFMVPHFLEATGLVTNTQNTFDTSFFITYTGGLPDGTGNGNAPINIYIFDDLTGQPLKSATNIDVCNPCSFTASAANRKGIATVEGIANSVGGLPRPTVTGSMIFEINGDSDDVSIDAHVFNSHTGPNDFSLFDLEVYDLDAGPGTTYYMVDRFHENSNTSDQPQSIKEEIFVLLANWPGLPTGTGTGRAELRIFDDMTGFPLRSSTDQPVCDPCILDLSTTQQKGSFNFDQLIRDAGGFPRPDVTGFAAITISGDTGKVFIQEVATNRHTTGNNVDIYGLLGPRESVKNVENQPPVRGFVLPHILEKTGTIDNTQYTFDTQIFATYTRGYPGFPPSSGEAFVDLYLYDDVDGLPLKSATDQEVCNPCSASMTVFNRKHIFFADDLITAAGGFPRDVVDAFGIVKVSNDVDSVSISGMIVNAKTSALDISILGFVPEEVRTPAFPLGHLRPDNLEINNNFRPTLFKEYDLPHFRDQLGRTDATHLTFDTKIDVAYAGGLAGIPDGGGASVDIYLYDEDTSLPLRSAINLEVCNPCSIALDNENRKRHIVIDDLITAAGGFPSLNVNGFGKIRVTGDADNVALTGTLVNSHNIDNDLSMSRLPYQERVRRATDFDFDGDGRADLGVFRPSDGTWYISNSSDGSFSARQWGVESDQIAPADYDGDSRADIAVWRPEGNGDPDRSYYYILQSSDSSFRAVQFGQAGDRPVAGDWDGDGKDDVGVYRDGSTPAEQSYFYHRPSGDPGIDFRGFAWGSGEDRPVVGDWDGDGRDDPAVFRPSGGVWYISLGEGSSVRSEHWGLGTDLLVPPIMTATESSTWLFSEMEFGIFAIVLTTRSITSIGVCRRIALSRLIMTATDVRMLPFLGKTRVSGISRTARTEGIGPKDLGH